METLLIFILAEFCFFTVVRYGLIFALNMWIKRNTGREYLYDYDTETHALIADDEYADSVRYRLTIPIENIATFIKTVKARKEDKVKIYPDWVYENKHIRGVENVIAEALNRKDPVTAMILSFFEWKYNDIMDTNTANVLYTIIMEYPDEFDTFSEAMYTASDSGEEYVEFIQTVVNTISSEGDYEKTEKLISAFNGTVLNHNTSNDWASEEELAEMDGNMDVVREKFIQAGCQNSIQALRQSIKTNSAILGLIVVYGDWIDENKVMLNNELTDTVVEALKATEGAYKAVFSQERFQEFANVLIANLEMRNKLDVVAEIAEMCK